MAEPAPRDAGTERLVSTVKSASDARTKPDPTQADARNETPGSAPAESEAPALAAVADRASETPRTVGPTTTARRAPGSAERADPLRLAAGALAIVAVAMLIATVALFTRGALSAGTEGQA
jgi:hypothetical protein